MKNKKIYDQKKANSAKRSFAPYRALTFIGAMLLVTQGWGFTTDKSSTISNDLTVGGTATTTTLNVTGTATIGSGLTVVGEATIGEATISGDLTVEGPASAQSMTITGDLQIDGSITSGGAQWVPDYVTVVATTVNSSDFNADLSSAQVGTTSNDITTVSGGWGVSGLEDGKVYCYTVVFKKNTLGNMRVTQCYTHTHSNDTCILLKNAPDAYDYQARTFGTGLRITSQGRGNNVGFEILSGILIDTGWQAQGLDDDDRLCHSTEPSS